MFPWKRFFVFFCILGTHTRRDIHKWYFSFGRPVGCFWGARRSVVTFCCVFVATRNVARPCSALGLFWAASRQDFLCFLCPGPIFWLCEARHVFFPRRGSTKSHICATLHHKTTNSAANRVTKSIFPPLCGRLSDHFLLLFGFFQNYGFCTI